MLKTVAHIADNTYYKSNIIEYIRMTVICLLCIFTLFNQEISAYETRHISNYIFRNIQNGDGLIDPQINSIIKDSDGFIWVGTPSNVQRFDGTQIVCYDFPYNQKSVVNTLIQCHEGSILVGCNNGLWSVDINTRELVRFAPEMRKPVYSLVVKDKRVYMATSDGVYAVELNGKIKKCSDVNIINLLSCTDGRLFGMSSNGLYLWNYESFINMGDGNIDCEFTCISEYGKSILVGTNGRGIYNFDKDTGCFNHILNIGNNRISAICIKSDMLVAGTDGTGIQIIDLNSKKVLLSLESHPDNDGQHVSSDRVRCVMADDIGIVWLGYKNHVGLDYIQYHNKPFNLFTNDDKLPYTLDYSKIYVDGSDKLFVANNGVFNIESSGRTKFYKFPNLSIGKYMEVRCVSKFDNRMLIGTSSGLFEICRDDEDLKKFIVTDGFEDVSVNCMAMNKDESLFIGTEHGLLIYKASDKNLVKYTEDNSNLKSDSIRYLYIDSRGRILVSTSAGVSVYNAKTGDFDDVAMIGLDNEAGHVTYMSEDSKGRILLVVNRHDAFVCEPDFTIFRRICNSEDAGFLGLFIEKIIQDSNHNYWFVGSRGVVKGNPNLSKYTLFSSTEGLIEPFSNDGQIFNDTLWVTTPNGVFYTYINSQIQPSVTKFTDIIVDGKSKLGEYIKDINDGRTVCFAGNENTIEFYFATLSYDHPYKMIYEYKLEGFDNEWRVLRGINHVTYKNLTNGTYKFIVRKQMDDAGSQSITFKITTPVNWGAYLAGIVIIVILIIIIILKKHSKEKQSIENREANSYLTDSEKYKFNKLSEKSSDSVAGRLKAYMEESRPYLNSDLKLSSVASALEVTPQVLSQVMNTRLNIRFNDYVNQLRIEYFKQYINSPEVSKYTLQSMAKICGFSSYSTFFRAFKDVTGQTPNEYLKGINQSKEGLTDSESLQTII